jgi:AAA domain
MSAGAPGPRHISEWLAEPTGRSGIRWIWHRMLPSGGLCLLAAYMKVGKSTLAYALGAAVAQGKPFLGLPTAQGRVLIIAAEERPDDAVDRLRHFGVGEADPVWLVAGNMEGDGGRVRQFVEAHGIRFVLIDTMTSFFAERLRDETNNSEITHLLMDFVRLCRDLDVTVLFTHHERKGGGDGGRSIRGGSAIFALMDQALILRGEQGHKPTERRLEIQGRYKWDSPGELILDYADEQWVSLGTPAERTRDAQRAKVLGALPAQGPGLDVAGLAKDTGITASSVRRLLKDLAAETPCAVATTGAGRKGDATRYYAPTVQHAEAA